MDAFAEAVDADAFENAADLLKLAGIDADTIATVLEKMRDRGGGH